MKSNIRYRENILLKAIFIILFLLIPSIIAQEYKADKDTINNRQKSTDATADKLKNEIDRILSARGLGKTNFAVAVYSLDEQKYYYRKNIDKLLTPASITKVITTFSALYALGGDFKLKTGVYTDSRKFDSVIRGDVFIYGRGDALLTVSDIDVLAKKMYLSGIRKIEGNIIADDSYFDGITSRKEYSEDYDNVEPLPPITALSIQRNTAIVIATSGSAGNVPVYITVIPRSESFIIENKAMVRGGKRTGALPENTKQKEFKVPYRNNNIVYNAGDAPPALRRRNRSSIRIATKEMPDCRQKFLISGSLNPNSTYSYQYFMDCPALATAGALKNALINCGIEVKGSISRGKISAVTNKPHLLSEFARPIMEIIEPTNKESDNYLAENLFKVIGAFAGKSKINSIRSREVERMIFDSMGIKCKDCLINDGSGLSRRNKITARALISLLVKAQYLPFAEEFYNSLAIAGIDGTLHKRMLRTQAENNLSAKTGTLRNVSGLAGYVTTVNNEQLIFAFLFNGPNVHDYKYIENQIGTLLATFEF